MSPPVDDPITRHGWGKELRWLLGAAAVLFVLASIHRALGFEQTRRETVEAAQQGAAEKVAIARTRIRERLLQVRRINDQLNHALATEPLERAAIEARLRETLGQEHQLFGVGVAFAPEALGPGSPLHEPGSSRYAPYYVDRDGTIEASPIEYDYTVHDCDEYDPRRPERCRNVWYGRTLARGAAWQEPHEGPASRQRIANYVSPLTRDEPVGAAKGRMGVVFTTLSTREYRQLLSELHLGPHSRALLISAADAFIVPPGPPTSESPTLVEQWDELAASAGDTSLAELLAEVRGIEGRSGEPPLLYDPLAEGERWAFAEPIGDGTGWVLVVLIDPEAIGPDLGLPTIHLVWALLHGLCALACVALGWASRSGRRRFVRTLAVCAALLSVAFAAAAAEHTWSYRDLEQATIDEAQAQAREAADEARGAIALVLAEVESTNADLRAQIEAQLQAGNTDPAALEALLTRTVDGHHEIFGAGVAFEPHAFDPSRERYAPYYARFPEGARIKPIEYDYLHPEPGCEEYEASNRNRCLSTWYQSTLRQQEGLWQEPHHGKTSGAHIANYTTPLHHPADGRVIGVVFTTLTVDDYQDLLYSLHLGETGYGFLLSAKGAFVAHPRRDYVREGKTLADLAEQRRERDMSDTGLGELLRHVEHTKQDPAGASGPHEIRDEMTGQTAWVHVRRISDASQWTLVIVFMQDDLHDELERLEPEILSAAMCILGLGLSLLLLWSARTLEREHLRPWLLSSGAALLLIVGNVFLVHQTVSGPGEGDDGVVPLPSRESIQGFYPGYSEQEAAPPTEPPDDDEPIFVPTGVYLQSIAFDTANDVMVTGYVWQRYPTALLAREEDDGPPPATEGSAVPPPATEGSAVPPPAPVAPETTPVDHGENAPMTPLPTTPETAVTEPPVTEPPVTEPPEHRPEGTARLVRPGFVMPEAVELESEQAYERIERDGAGNEHKVIGWTFNATLRQTFDYSMYPFDKKTVRLHFWHREFDRAVILVPDLAAYEVTSQSTLLGIEERMVMPGWTLEASYFGVRDSSYDTDFGIKGYVGRVDFPELYFSVRIVRDFRNALITNVIPLIVVAFMLFGLLVSMTEDDRDEKIGFTFLDGLGVTSGLFFVVLLSHIDLRKELSQDLIYLEVFYFLMYFVILGVSVIAYRVAREASPEGARLGAWAQLQYWYWPLLMMASLWITLYFMSA